MFPGINGFVFGRPHFLEVGLNSSFNRLLDNLGLLFLAASSKKIIRHSVEVNKS
jgi:hypothetical protein